METKLDEIIDLVAASVKEVNDHLGKPDLANPTPETRLYGAEGAFDSLALVSLIADIEGNISEKLGKDIVLADERAISQKRSPFRNIRSLAEYIKKLLDEE